ncbi:MAG: hypothetical protein QNJ22_03385 [Desulfosarcinaceae bacterium]|nr:hypothetical protein [Desulfosarcinaceae bacterium]
MRTRKSHLLLVYLTLNLIAFCGMFVQAAHQRSASQAVLQRNRTLVRQLGLTDLCLFTDARYTRHPAMADLHTPFQDYPMSFEHFPSGSLMPPPPHLRSHGAH